MQKINTTYIVGAKALSRWLPKDIQMSAIKPYHISASFLEKQIQDLQSLHFSNPDHQFIGITDQAMFLLAAAFQKEAPALAKSIATMQHKGLFYTLLQKEHINTKPWAVTSSVPPTDLQFPLFYRPIRGSFSEGSMCVYQMDKIPRLSKPAVSQTLAKFFETYSTTPLSSFLVQEIITAPQYTVDYFVSKNKVHITAVTTSFFDKKNTSFIGFETPTDLPESVLEKVTQQLQKIVSALSIPTGFYNAEFFVLNSEVYLIECNSRVSAQFLSLFNYSLKKNYLLEIVRLANGYQPVFAPQNTQKAHIFVLRTSLNKKTKSLPSKKSITDLEKKYGLIELHITAKAHTHLSKMRQDGNSFRYAYATIPGAFLEKQELHAQLRKELLDLLF